MIEISKPLEYFQSCNCCGRYNKRGPGTEQMYKSLCKDIREYTIRESSLSSGFVAATRIRLCEDCAKQFRDQLNGILEDK